MQDLSKRPAVERCAQRVQDGSISHEQAIDFQMHYECFCLQPYAYIYANKTKTERNRTNLISHLLKTQSLCKVSFFP
ncbi:hypothetical protein FHS56_000551 [Thermonema lapsum]|uniref:Uncharacterized protein n=1 Tax=Thermonema lapsum TaxID=28195 RepID=A0A846MNN4_9BACT|nr:hypothetical protein [Thermonema lapsum]